MNTEAISDRIIVEHTTYAVAAAAIPLPLVDVAAITAIQMDCVRALAKVHEAEFDVATGKALIASLVGASAARIGASAAKAVPGVGLIPGVVTQAGLSGASTYAIGRLFQGHFARQGTLRDFDLDTARSTYDELLSRGKDFVRSLGFSRRRSPEETATSLERIVELKERDALDEEEFQRLKREILAVA